MRPRGSATPHVPDCVQVVNESVDARVLSLLIFLCLFKYFKGRMINLTTWSVEEGLGWPTFESLVDVTAQVVDPAGVVEV